MSSYLRHKYERGRYILQKEGPMPFFMMGLRFLRKSVFIQQMYDKYELPLKEPTILASTPEIQDSSFEIVATSKRFKELVAQGFDFGINMIGAEEKLDKGALMFCIFIGKEFAGIHWAAANQEAINALMNIRCYKSDFLSDEAYLGWSETDPQYRRLGLFMYIFSEKQRLLATMGKTTGKCLVARNNIASRKATIKCGGRIYSEGRYLKILWWKSWKEKPVVSETDQPRLVERTGV